MSYQSIGQLDSALGQTFRDSYFGAKKYPCSLGDIWLTVCMLTVALFVISGDLDPILDYGQVKSHYEDLQPHPPPQKGDDGW